MADEVRDADTGRTDTTAEPAARSTATRAGAVALGVLLGLMGLMVIGAVGFAVAFYLFVSECSC